jgi:paraquat-inducible protein A
LFGWLERIGPWAMVEVFIFGAIVAYTRLQAIADVEIGPSMMALAGVMVALIAADASMDRRALWEALGRPGATRPPPATDGADLLVGCHVCGLVARSFDRAPCTRCGHRLHARKPDSIRRSWAFTLAAAALYIPANVLPVMTVNRMGRGGPHTILGGVRALFEDDLWPLALIVLVASVVVPLVKLGALALMLTMTQRRSSTRLTLRARVFRVIATIGRWSMIDIFALTILVAVVRLDLLATVFPEDGAVAFSAVVILTMLATEFFDPRLMWDAACPARPAEASWSTLRVPA